MLDSIRSGAQSLGVKIIFGVIILVFIFWGIGNVGSGSPSRLVTIGGEDISLHDFGEKYNAALQAERTRNPKLSLDEKGAAAFKRQVLSQMVLERIRLQEAARLGLFVTPQELFAIISQNPAFQDEKGSFDKTKYVALLTANKRSPGTYEEGLSRELLQEKLMGYIAKSASLSEAEAKSDYNFLLEQRKAEYVLFATADYRDKVALTDEEIAAYYESNKGNYTKPAMAELEYLSLTPATLAEGYAATDKEVEDYYKEHTQDFSEAEKYQARHIFLRCPPDSTGGDAAKEAVAKAKAAMEDIAGRLAKGEGFSDLAKKYSDDKPTAELGGLLPWMDKGQMGLPEFDAAALALKKGEVSAPLRSSFGFHLIRLEDKTPASTKPLAEVKGEIAVMLGKDKAANDFKRVQTLADDALNTATPFAELAKTLHISVQQTGLVELDTAVSALGATVEARRIVEDAILGAAVPSAAPVAPAAPSANATAPANAAASANATAPANAAASANATAPAVAMQANTGLTIPVPVNIADGIALVRVKQAHASYVPLLAEVRTVVVSALTDSHALVLAKNAAQEALSGFTGPGVPQKYAEAVKTTGAFNRIYPVLQPLGDASGLAEALFQAPQGQWLTAAYDTSAGAVTARVSEIIPAPEAEWERQRGQIMQSMLRSRQEQAVNAFMQHVFAQTEIKEAASLEETLKRIR